jgi:hypothetical protein
MAKTIVKNITMNGRNRLGDLGQPQKVTGIKNPIPIYLAWGSWEIDFPFRMSRVMLELTRVGIVKRCLEKSSFHGRPQQ